MREVVVSRRASGGHRLVRLAAMLLLAAGVATPAQAQWLTRIGRGLTEAAEVGAGSAGRAARGGLSAIEAAALHVKGLPVTGKGAALAAEVSGEGHWTFVNRAGERFTAGTPAELARVGANLAPDAAGAPLTLYLTEKTAFEGRGFLKNLPDSAKLHIVVEGESFPLMRATEAAGLAAEIRPGLRLAMTDEGQFREAMWQLQRPLNRANIRLLALEIGGPDRLASVPKFDPATKTALVDKVSPDRLAGALTGVRGQSVLVSGRVEGEVLRFEGGGSGLGQVRISELEAAAEAADVNLVILDTASARQPGGRNWLWQKVAVKGLPEAMARSTFGDFLAELGAARGGLTVSAGDISSGNRGAHGRVRLTALPLAAGASPVSGPVGGWLESVTTETLGNVVAHGVHAYVRDSDHQRELDDRLIPGIPSGWQWGYIVAFLAGLYGLPVAECWFRRLWPAERAKEYAGRIGYWLATGVRGLTLVLVFAPLVSPLSVIVRLGQQIVEAARGLRAIALFPFRWALRGRKV